MFSSFSNLSSVKTFGSFGDLCQIGSLRPSPSACRRALTPQLQRRNLNQLQVPVCLGKTGLTYGSRSQLLNAGVNNNNDLDDLEMQVVRYKPEGLGSLCKNTKFSRKELQIMYRGFKQECPTGIVNEEGFKEIYAQFFPQGDSSSYAHFVFKTFDVDNNGSLSFEEFVTGLSVLSRGNINDRLQWAFNLYDINGDGIVTRDEMLQIVSAIYDMMGKHSEPVIDETTARNHVDFVFQKMDLNHDGVITYEEFMESCRKDKNIMNGLVISDTALCVSDSMPNSPAAADTRNLLLPAQLGVAGQQINPLTPPGAGFHNNNIQDTLVPMT